MVPRATPKTCWAARKLRRSVATARSTFALRSGAVSWLLGVSTRLTPRARQRNRSPSSVAWKLSILALL